MALDINNADFKLFTGFAATAKMSARARLDSTVVVLNGAEKTIKELKRSGSSDFIGNIARDFKCRVANDNVRQLFRDTVAKMFGGENHIPESVLTAMKLEDYGKGKPLTARRIVAVKNAIERFAKDVKTSEKIMSESTRYKGLPRQEIAALTDTMHGIYETCEGSAEREVIANSVVQLTLRGDNTVRSPADIKKKTDAIKANFRELRAAAKGNQQILAAGKFMMNAISGKSLPEGLIGKLVALANGKDVKMNLVRRLDGTTGPVTIHRALIQLEKNAEAVFESIGAQVRNLDTDMANAIKDFVTRVSLLRIGPNRLGNIQQALTGANAAQLNQLANYIKTNDVIALPLPDEDIQKAVMGDPDKEIPKDLNWEIQNTMSDRALHGLLTTSAIVAEILGEDRPELPDIDPSEIPENTIMILEDAKEIALDVLEKKQML